MDWAADRAGYDLTAGAPRRRALARAAGGAVSALLVLVSWRPAMPAGNLDPSWQSVLRAPMLWVTLRLRSGAEERFRFVPTMAHGFVLSPAVTEPDHLEALFRAGPGARLGGREVVSVTVESSPRTDWFYEPAFAVRFYRIEPRPRPEAAP